MSSLTLMRGASLRSAPFVQAKPITKAPLSRVALKVEANKKVQKKQQIILMKDIVNVGSEGEIKFVPVGYWRNYLLPNYLAKIASSSILDQIQAKKDAEVRAKLEEKAQAQAFANALATISKFVLKKKTGDKDQIYGSVQISEIADAIYQQTGRDVSGGDFTVPEIKAIGTYECQLKLHPEVNATFSVVVQREKGITIKANPEPQGPKAATKAKKR